MVIKWILQLHLQIHFMGLVKSDLEEWNHFSSLKDLCYLLQINRQRSLQVQFSMGKFHIVAYLSENIWILPR